MSTPPPNDTRNWFTTLPGILASAGGFVAALTGLLVALNQVGILPVKTAPAASPAPHDGATPVAPANIAGSAPASEAQTDALLSLMYETRQLEVLGTTGCSDAKSVMIRFKVDGQSGCALYGRATRGPLHSGANVILVPVSAAGQGTAFDLLYDDQGWQIRFVGTLPGDGSGNLSVSLENGVIVERNGLHEKRSTLRSGAVVPD